mmetsp:Transcript_45085/g.133476  ORF Transcript_45085/g.133476 Transcript_45085/m.133476 type:complete len:234 (-) Transcript_45085:275-976(-)
MRLPSSTIRPEARRFWTTTCCSCSSRSWARPRQASRSFWSWSRCLSSCAAWTETFLSMVPVWPSDSLAAERSCVTASSSLASLSRSLRNVSAFSWALWSRTPWAACLASRSGLRLDLGGGPPLFGEGSGPWTTIIVTVDFPGAAALSCDSRSCRLTAERPPPAAGASFCQSSNFFFHFFSLRSSALFLSARIQSAILSSAGRCPLFDGLSCGKPGMTFLFRASFASPSLKDRS